MDLRRRIVAAYHSGLCTSYENAAELFGIGRATVSRLLRLHRETSSVEPKPMGGNNPRRVCLEWLKKHAESYPDARLEDRITDWEKAGGRRVSSSTMSSAMRAIGWTYKKNAGGHRKANPRGDRQV